MIVKVGEGSHDPAGLIAYLGGPGNLDEHIGQRVVASAVGQTGALDKAMQEQVVSDLRLHAKMWGANTKHVWHATLAIGKNEGILPDQTWSGISKDYVTGMELDGCRWVSVNHGPSAKGNDHVHVVASLVRADGTQASTSKDGYRSRDLAIHLEDKYGLKPLPGRRQGISGRPVSQKDLARMRDQGLPESRRDQIERTVRAAASVVADVHTFEQLLKVNGLEFHPYISSSGKITGYSVSTQETRTKAGVVHRWAGGKLARDLSLPRLELVWKSNTSIRPTHIRAVQELQELQRLLKGAGPAVLEDASHQLAGALASVSLATESTPGELAAASKAAGAYAQTVRPSLRPKPPALSVGLLFLQATDPGGPAGKTVMIMQLLAAYRALMDAQFARRGLVTTRERTPSMAGQAGPEEEMVEIGVTAGITTGAVLLERHARKQEAAAQSKPQDKKGKDPDLWDASDIRKFRQQDKAAREAQRVAQAPTGSPVSTEQLERAQRVADQLDMPSVKTLAASMTEQEAEKYLTQLEGAAGPLPEVQQVRQEPVVLSPEQFEQNLEAKHGDKIPLVVERPSGPELARPGTWKTGDLPATEAQVKWLTTKGGLPLEEAQKMTKAGASSYRNSQERAQGLTQPPRTPKPPTGRTPGRGV